jgi:hypothetical protein
MLRALDAWGALVRSQKESEAVMAARAKSVRRLLRRCLASAVESAWQRLRVAAWAAAWADREWGSAVALEVSRALAAKSKLGCEISRREQLFFF